MVLAIAGLGAGKSVLLALFGLVGGVGITALGPGGVLITIGLLAITGLSPPGISGTAIATNLGCALLGAGAYRRSGQLHDPETRRLAWLLVAAAIVGTPVGVLVNSHLSGALFGALLGVCVIAVGALLWWRVRGQEGKPSWPALPALLAGGVLVAAVSGLFGLGGQLLSVPLLVAGGVPMLLALGAAQVQSIVIAGVGTVGYALRGDVHWDLVAVVGVPALVGVLAGWRLARGLAVARLQLLLAGALVLVGIYLIARNL